MSNELNNRLKEALRRLQHSREDEAAWQELYESTFPMVLTTLFHRLKGYSGAAEDLCQDVYVRVIRYLPLDSFKSKEGEPDIGAFRGYLWATCNNVARMYLSEVLRKNTESLDDSHAAKILSDAAPLHVASEMQSVLDKALELADKKDKQIVLYILAGFSFKDIAEGTGLSAQAARVRLYRLRQRLKEYFDRTWD